MTENESGRQIDGEAGPGPSEPGALHEINTPAADPVREEKDRDLHDPAHVDVDPDVLRNGGPTRTPGMMTTTGGTAGPNSVKRHSNRLAGEKVAPTTTGDATTGGFTSAAGSTSDASSAVT